MHLTQPRALAAILVCSLALAPVGPSQSPTPKDESSASFRIRLCRRGEALAGVRVRLLPFGSGADAAPALSATSDANGTLDLAHLPRCKYLLVADHADLPLGWFLELPQTEEPRPFDRGSVQVPQTGVVTGRVRDAKGKPVAGARVELRFGEFDMDWLYSLHLGTGGELLVQNALPRTTTSGKDGRFRIVGAGVGIHAVEIRSESGVASASFELQEGESRRLGTMQLRPGGEEAKVVSPPRSEQPARAAQSDPRPELSLRGVVRGFPAALIEHAAIEALGPVATGRPAGRFAARIDARGRFGFENLSVGDYVLELRIGNEKNGGADMLPYSRPLPVLGANDWRFKLGRRHVAGTRPRSIELEMPELGEIRGCVLSGRAPVPFAIVHARRETLAGPEPSQETSKTPVALDPRAHESHSWVRCDAQGRYRLFVARAGAWRVHARAPGDAVGSSGAVVRLAERSSRVAQHLFLGDSSVSGRWTEAVAEAQDLVAVLVPMQHAALDPATRGFEYRTLHRFLTRTAIGADGRFAFDGLPPGDWSLRILDRNEDDGTEHRGTLDIWRRWKLVFQSHVRTEKGAATDLGKLQPGRRIDVRFACRTKLPEPAPREAVHRAPPGIWIRRLRKDGSPGSWVASARLGATQRTLALPPGRYEAQLFDEWYFSLTVTVLYPPERPTWTQRDGRDARCRFEVPESGLDAPIELRF